jgi:tRNA A-37 threonylcarbamoyl transferase component Bud32
MTMESQNNCPNCNRALGDKALQGLCPDCLIKGGWPTSSQKGESRFALPTRDELAKQFPHLQILELIGQGGMGAVYKARQPKLDRLVALKVLTPQTSDDPGFAERFTREARALARLSHPGIVSVHEFGQKAKLHYLVMEYVDGPNLREIQKAGRLSPRQALQIIPQICAALQFAHDEGVVHRDIKPENVLLDQKGQIKIADFGLAKIMGTERSNFTLTESNHVMGTAHYMAPEQVEHPQDVDHRADIYSLGVVVYEMLTGELPLGRFQPPSKKVQLDVRLDEVVLRSLAKEPGRRYQHANQVKTDVETIVATPGRNLGVFCRHHLHVSRLLMRTKALGQWISQLIRAHRRKLLATLSILCVCGLLAMMAWAIAEHGKQARLDQRLAVKAVFTREIQRHLRKYRFHVGMVEGAISANLQEADLRLRAVSCTAIPGLLNLDTTALVTRYLGQGQWLIQFCGQVVVPDLTVDTSELMARGPLAAPPAPLPGTFDGLGLPYPQIKVVRAWDGVACLFPDPLAAMDAWRKTAEYQAWRKIRNMASFTHRNLAGFSFTIHTLGWQADGVELLNRVEIRRPDKSLLAVAHTQVAADRDYQVLVYSEQEGRPVAMFEVHQETQEDKEQKHVTSVYWGERGGISQDTALGGNGIIRAQVTKLNWEEEGLFWQVNRFGVAFKEAVKLPQFKVETKQWIPELEDAPYLDTITDTVHVDGAPRFGATHELVLQSSPILENCFLNLHTGRVFSASSELVNALQTHPQLGPFLGVAQPWLKAQGVDLMMWKGQLLQLDPCGDRLNLSLDDPYAEILPKYVKLLVQTARDKRPVERTGGFTYPNGLRVFVTREGSLGLLEILERNVELGGARLRFKRVE